jgi:hypothetical protein
MRRELFAKTLCHVVDAVPRGNSGVKSLTRFYSSRSDASKGRGVVMSLDMSILNGACTRIDDIPIKALLIEVGNNLFLLRTFRNWALN